MAFVVCRCGCGSKVVSARFKYSGRKQFLDEKHRQKYFNRLYVQEKRPSRVRQKHKWLRKRLESLRGMVAARKNRPCVDCGVRYPSYIMDFDHVRGEKLFALGNIGGKNLATILAEIGKCEVVCANCHRTRTYRRRRSNHGS